MALIYELNNGRKSGTLPVMVPFNILHMLSPLQPLSNYEFKGLWNKVQINQSPFPQSLLLTKTFNLNLQRISNLTKLKQILCFTNGGFAVVQDVESQQNMQCFAAQLNRREILECYGVGANEQHDMVTWIMMKLSLTKDGNDCSIQVASCRDVH